ncbi:MAG: threonine/serine dehydratase [Thermoplasmata archaeon]
MARFSGSLAASRLSRRGLKALPEQPSPADVEQAAELLRQVVRCTSLTRSASLSEASGAEVYLKWENQQHTGSFKLRGAYNLVASLPPDALARGLVTASVGNHGAAVAFIAHLRGLRATIVLPETAIPFKIQRCRVGGVDVRVEGASYDDAVEVAQSLADREGMAYIPATEHPRIMAGQGTIAMEILEERPETDALIVPVGGGGLIVGMAVWAKAVRPAIRIIGVQSTAAHTMYDSVQAGRVVGVTEESTLADGIVGGVTANNLALVRAYVDEMVLAEEEGIHQAMEHIRLTEDQMIEGAGAVGVAALLQGKLDLRPGDEAVILVSGGNVDPSLPPPGE